MEMQLSTILILGAELISADLSHALSRDGYRVWVAMSGAEALDRCRTARPDLLIVDIPPLEAKKRTAMRLIREAFPIPIIALGSAEVAVESLDTGAAHFITKPVAVDEVRARVRALLRRAGGNPGLSP